jgi:hypothetical protein
MSKIGLFLKNNFQDKLIEIHTRDATEWVSYSDADAISYTIILAYCRDYDDESGVLTMESVDNKIFYMGEENVNFFCDAEEGFNVNNTMKSTIQSGNRWNNKKHRDIM